MTATQTPEDTVEADFAEPATEQARPSSRGDDISSRAPSHHPKPWVRVTILLGSLALVCAIAYLSTGQVIPTDPRDALIFQTSLVLLVLGSALIEHKFTKPADALVNSLMGLITIAPVYHIAPRPAWWIVMVYTLAVFVTAAVCVALSEKPFLTGWRLAVASTGYRFAVFFGKARLYFSILLLFSVWAFYSLQDPRTGLLVVFWGLYLSIWPLGIPHALSALTAGVRQPVPIGRVVRTEWPNIMRIQIPDASSWRHERPKLCRQVDGTGGWILPLYCEQQADQILGTGLFVSVPDAPIHDLAAGGVYEPPTNVSPPAPVVAQALEAPAGATMIGYVVEESEIGTIRFETWEPGLCREGGLVRVNANGRAVYYQIINGLNREESSYANRRGYQIAVAAQIGIPDSKQGFVKFGWLPWMNAPVFALPPDFGADLFTAIDHEIIIGTIPSSQVPVRFSSREAFDHHIAILGVTGSGKTELAFDLIRHAITCGTKVVCIDLTARYADRLADLTPRQLSLDEGLAVELSNKLFAVETGTYGAGNEKKALGEFRERLQQQVTSNLEAFLQSSEESDRVGLVTLPEISNTKATLYITELYLTLLLRYAKEKGPASPRILVVLEEAHTVIPEASTMGLGDYDSKGLVGKISQIALQGRKYRVGLLVIAQRTATASKTVLTQCNTVISFSCIDDTSIGFLSHVYGSDTARLLPNLGPLQAVIYGKAVRSQRPLVFEIPFDAAKAAAADAEAQA